MKFTKHFYIEGQRIVSKLGDRGASQFLLMDRNTQVVAGGNTIDYDNKMLQHKEFLMQTLVALGLDGAVFTAGKSGKIPYGQLKKFFREHFGNGATPGDTATAPGNGNEKFRYFYHPDHLGSSSYITDASGEVYQHNLCRNIFCVFIQELARSRNTYKIISGMEYFPFGETFIEERTDSLCRCIFCCYLRACEENRITKYQSVLNTPATFTTVKSWMKKLVCIITGPGIMMPGLVCGMVLTRWRRNIIVIVLMHM